MKRYKPGQIVSIGDGSLYRAKRRTSGCEGCDLNDLRLCPCVRDKRAKPVINCGLDNIVLKKTN